MCAAVLIYHILVCVCLSMPVCPSVRSYAWLWWCNKARGSSICCTEERPKQSRWFRSTARNEYEWRERKGEDVHSDRSSISHKTRFRSTLNRPRHQSLLARPLGPAVLRAQILSAYFGRWMSPCIAEFVIVILLRCLVFNNWSCIGKFQNRRSMIITY